MSIARPCGELNSPGPADVLLVVGSTLQVYPAAYVAEETSATNIWMPGGTVIAGTGGSITNGLISFVGQNVDLSSSTLTMETAGSGVGSVASKGVATVLKAKQPTDTNSLEEPKKIVPVIEKAKRLGTDFTRTFPPYSITVLELQTKN